MCSHDLRTVAVAKKASPRKTVKKTKAVRTGGAKRPAARKTAARALKASARSATTATAEAKATRKSPRKSRLSKTELADFRDRLLGKRRSLLGDMNGIEAEALHVNRKDGSGDLSSMPTHPADLGTDNYEQEFTLGLLESERQLLNEIDEALARIRKGTYGVCQGTGKPITKARLRARPWSKYGIEYARMIEKGLVRPNEVDEDGSDGDGR